MDSLPRYLALSLLRFDKEIPIGDFSSSRLATTVRYSSRRPDNLNLDGSIEPNANVFCHLALCEDERSSNFVVDELAQEAVDLPDVTESIQIALRPYMHRGTLNWLDRDIPSPIFEPHEKPAQLGPIVVMTSGGYTEPPETQMERVTRFIENTVAVGEDILNADGLKFRRLFSPSPEFDDPITLTAWESEEHIAKYAYQPGAHLDRVKPQNESNYYFDRNSFTRFTVMRSEGEWEGVRL